jgi:hypothetical protein
MAVAMILRRVFFTIWLVVTVATSCSLAPRQITDVTGNMTSAPHEHMVSPGPWETPDPDHEGISNIVIVASVVALVLLFIAFDRGWLTPHF